MAKVHTVAYHKVVIQYSTFIASTSDRLGYCSALKMVNVHTGAYQKNITVQALPAVTILQGMYAQPTLTLTMS